MTRRVYGRTWLGLAGVAVASCVGSAGSTADEPAGGGAAAPSASLAATPGVQATATARFQLSARPVAGSYIVQLADGTAPADVEATATALLAQYGGTRTAVYTHALQGFAARMPEAAARRMSGDARVHHVEQDAIAHGAQVFGSGDALLGADATGTTTAPTAVDAISSWALDRIDQRAPPPLVGGIPQFNGQYTWHATGYGVHVYLIDSLFNSSHLDQPYNDSLSYFDGLPGLQTSECAGHGTMMESIIGGRVAGVAKNITLHPVRVLDCNNETDLTRLLQGTDWVAANAVKPAVVNLSISGPSSTSFNTAVANLVNVTGITVVGAAGNGNTDACTTSPASEPTTLTVGAASGYDKRSDFSNYGSCVDLNAPGTSTDAAFYDISSSTRVARQRATGTSTATALVTGAAALYLERYPDATPAQVRAALINNASSGYLDATTLSGSPNLLLYTLFVPYAAQNVSGQELGTDYVTNGGFESGATGWTLTGNASVGTSTSYPPYAGSKRLLLSAGIDSRSRLLGGSAERVLSGVNAAGYSSAPYVIRYRVKIGTDRPNSYADNTKDGLTVSLANVSYLSRCAAGTSGGIQSLYSGQAFYNGATSDGYREMWYNTGCTALYDQDATHPVTLVFNAQGSSGTSAYTTTYSIDNVRFVRALPGTPTTMTALLNPNFELGDNGNWTWSRSSGSAFIAGGGGANGSWKIRLGGWADGVAHTDTLYQNFAIPAGVVAPRVTIPITVAASGFEGFDFDTVVVQVRNPTTNAVLATLDSIAGSSGYPTPTTLTRTYALDRWVGQTVRLYLMATSNNNTVSTTFTADNLVAQYSTAWASPVLP